MTAMARSRNWTISTVTNALCASAVALADWSYGCSHRRTTFPITLPTNAGTDQPRRTRVETYIACLECGRRFPYDWATMRITREPIIRTPGWPGSGATGTSSRFVAVNGLFHRLLGSSSTVKA